jgi:very-short-patch-repair endonuclease
MQKPFPSLYKKLYFYIRNKGSMPRNHYKSYKGITLLARDLRKNQTHSEIILWEILPKKKVLGYKFLRQHPICYRINKEWVDFYCAKLKLIIELDGPIHDNRKEYDSGRDSILLNKGIKTVRIKNKGIDNINNIILKIQGIVNLRDT